MGEDAMKFKELQSVINFLHERAPEDTVPQLVYAGADKKALVWIPGGFRGMTNYSGPKINNARFARFVGLTPGAFESPVLHQHEQRCWISFLGFDIDAHKNKLSVEKAAKIVMDHCPEMSLRTSGGGQGLHGFIRLAEPILIPAGANRGKVVQSLAAPIAKRLADAGLGCAMEKWDFRTFYVCGGKQKWYHVTTAFVDMKFDPAMVEMRSDHFVEIAAGNLEPVVQEFVDHLAAAGIPLRMGKNQIHVRRVQDALSSTRWAFETKSATPPEVADRRNGFITVQADRADIFANADGFVVRCIVSPKALAKEIGL